MAQRKRSTTASSLIARAIASRNTFLTGRDDGIDARLGVRRDYLAVLVRLSYLSPEIVRAILAGQQPVELTPTRLIALSRNLPHDWQEQRQLLGFAPALPDRTQQNQLVAGQFPIK